MSPEGQGGSAGYRNNDGGPPPARSAASGRATPLPRPTVPLQARESGTSSPSCTANALLRQPRRPRDVASTRSLPHLDRRAQTCAAMTIPGELHSCSYQQDSVRCRPRPPLVIASGIPHERPTWRLTPYRPTAETTKEEHEEDAHKRELDRAARAGNGSCGRRFDRRRQRLRIGTRAQRAHRVPQRPRRQLRHLNHEHRRHRHRPAHRLPVRRRTTRLVARRHAHVSSKAPVAADLSST
jgi:hypothetical protein